jgi:hypothetical protein
LLSPVNRIAIFAALALPLLIGGCIGEPFGYAEDRCLGAHNQCQTDCTDLDDGPARSACIERCYQRESECYATGYQGSSIAVDRAVGAARTQAEKEAAFQRWKAQRARESAEKAAQEAQETTPDPGAEPQD